MSYQIRDDYQVTKAVAWYESQYRTSLRAKVANWGEQQAFRTLLSRVPKTGSVLDIACGTGRFTAVLLNRGYQVTGVDVSPEMLAVARRQFGSQANLAALQVGDAE